MSPPDHDAATPQPFWRSLEERADTDEFRSWLQREFPQLAVPSRDSKSRRDFLKVMGSALAMASLAGCARQPEEHIVPYTEIPEHIVPGKPLYFATAAVHGGFAQRVLAESHEGRPTRVEGNRKYSSTGSALGIFAQAAVLGLYDPDRSRVARRRRTIGSWQSFLTELKPRIDGHRSRGDRRLRILTQTTTSPTLADQLQTLQQEFPDVWHQYEPVHRDNSLLGTRLALGEDADCRYHLDQADVIVAIDADFLGDGPARQRLAREFARRRQVRGQEPGVRSQESEGRGQGVAPARSALPARLYSVESRTTLTGAAADHRLPLAPGRIEQFVRLLAARLGVDVEAPPARLTDTEQVWLEALANDLQAGAGGQSKAGRAVIIVGPSQSPIVHALGHAMNARLGAIGRTVTFSEPVAAQPTEQLASLRELTEAMRAGDVQSLLILGGNPAFDAPANLEFAEALAKVPFSVHHGLYENETARQCTWHIPATHDLESWSDARTEDGTATILQPLIAPLYNGKTVHEFLGAVLGQPNRTAYDTVRGYWENRQPVEDFEKSWQRWLHEGLVDGTAAPEKTVRLRDDFKSVLEQHPARSRPDAADQADRSGSPPAEEAVEIVFCPDPTVYDGRYANNAWLQELPKPFTKLTWSNAALIGPSTAERHDLQNGDVVELARQGRSIRIPVWVVPGQPDGVVALSFGYGRTAGGRVAAGRGTDVFPLRTDDAMWFAPGAGLKKTGERSQLASTQHHQSIDGRDLIRAGTLQEYRSNPSHPPFMAAEHAPSEGVSFYPQRVTEGYQWGMSINLGACIGCNACVVACQAENNIPTVGEPEVARGREMHWLRIDTYFSGEPDNPRAYHQPVPCMHCEHAPCEVVCPVAATTHSDEGLNEMTYNRCIGTRYCSNNCPYKVRRFNFFDYHRQTREEPVLHLLQNPDVSVRSRGVMEKCTYCVQRINAARINAEIEGREIRDGEVVTACQAACPTEAIVFGDISDPGSRVAQAKAHPLDYGLLEELNTRPRTTYLAAVKNPNPQLEGVES